MLNFKEKAVIVEKVIDLLKHNKLNQDDKETMYKIVMSISNKTDKQKDRFTKFYNLQPSQKEHYTLSAIAQQYSCSISAINCSIIAIRAALIRLPENEIMVLKKIADEYLKT